jgi:iron complex outermembrane receptor protein
LQGHASLRWSPLQKPFFLESRWRWVDDQDRIAAIKGETATDGYVVGNIRAGYQLSEEAMLYGGVRNLSDNFYINHLNTKNPFTGRQIPEPGRSYYLKFQYAF